MTVPIRDMYFSECTSVWETEARERDCFARCRQAFVILVGTVQVVRLHDECESWRVLALSLPTNEWVECSLRLSG